MLSSERRIEGDTERKYVTGVFFGQSDVYELERALVGHAGALGADEKSGRDIVMRHLNRLLNQGEPYMADDLADLVKVLSDLMILWQPQTTVEWWRQQGATGADDAIEGLARERERQSWQAHKAREIVREVIREMYERERS